MKRRMVLALMVLCMALALLPGMTVEAKAYETGNTYKGSAPWGFNFYGECTSFVAHCLSTRNEVVAKPFHGDAKVWGTTGNLGKFPVDDTPAVGAVAWWSEGTEGHVAWVKAVDGDMVTTEEYNWNKDHAFHTATFNRYGYSDAYQRNAPRYIHVKDIVTIIASGNCGDKGDNVTWTLDSNGTLTIRGSGKMKDYIRIFDCPWGYDDAAIKRIKTIVIEQGITLIGDYSFSCCTSLTSVIIPNSVTLIGNWAFSDCNRLNVTIPNGVTSIGDAAFAGCKSLTSGTIPNSVTSIGDRAFFACSSLTNVTIPNSVTSIGKDAFWCCSNLTSVTIPNSVTSIEDWTFASCESLTSVTIPNGVTSIGDTAFYRCKNLTSITIPSSVTSIGREAFHYCDKLSDVYYSGNEKQWSAISIGDLNDPLRKAYIHVNTPIALTTVTVNFNAHNGTVYTKKVTTGKTYGTLRTPTRSGYTFDGWYTAETGGTKVTSTTKVTATTNHTLHAHWTKNKYYTVTFNANGGTAYTKTKTVTGGKTYGTLPTPTRENYHFTGWYTTKSIGGKKVTSAAKVNLKAKQTLYARWSKSAVKASATKNGSWQVTLPRTSKVPLYTTSTTAAMRAAIETGTRSWVLSCTRRVTLSNGTTRYYTKVDNKPYWFTYSYEMKVK